MKQINQTITLRLSMAALSLSASLALLAQGPVAPNYSLRIIGPAKSSPLPCMGIDSIGRVAGTCEYEEDGATITKGWTYDPVLGYLLSPSEPSTINAVSPDGLLVGSSFGTPTVFDWYGNPQVVFADIAGCFMAVNSRHDAAGYIYDPSQGYLQTAAVYDRNGNLVQLNDPNVVSSAAYGINNSGLTCGYATDINGVGQAFCWNGTLSFLPGPEGCSNVAVGVNNARGVVGYSVTPTDQVLPIRWTVSFAIASRDVVSYEVIKLPEGFDNGVVTAVNDNNVAVGTMWARGGEQRAYLTRPSGPVIDLNDLKPASARVYKLISANAINANGQITGIAEVMIHAEPTYVGYVLTPKFPISLGGGIRP